MEARRRALTALVIAVIVLVASGCTAADRPFSGRVAAPVSWRRISLPADPRGTPLIKAVGHCAVGWYVAGAIVDQSKNNHPALWFSSDGTSFTPVTIKPISVYGPQNILYSVACNNTAVVAVGAAVGGAHGNPRTSTWYGPVADATLTEARASFETYGGPDAVGVGPVAAGGAGFLIVGGRVDANKAVGAAVWTSSDGSSFKLIDNDPALESGPNGTTELHGGYVGASGGPAWLAVGGLTPPTDPGAARNPAVWTSSDGATWHLDKVSSSGADDTLEQVTSTSSGLLAVGIDGDGFGAWTASGIGGVWRKGGHFGAHGAATAVPRTVGLARVDPTVYAAIYDGSSYHLWRGSSGGTHWDQVALPPGARTVAAISGSGSAALVATTTANGSSELYVTFA